MSPREKHIPDNAQRTSVCLTAEDRAAIRWISETRRALKNRRTTTNDVLVDALWFYLEKAQRKTRDEIKATIPVVVSNGSQMSNVTRMPKRRK
jgi:hypothetical protein